MSDLERHNKTVQTENETLKQDLTTTSPDLSAHVETLKIQLAGAEAGEKAAKTEKAVAAFEQLAQRLEAIVQSRRPWRRLVSGLGAFILAAARERRLRSLAAAPRSDLQPWAPASRWPGPPLSDG